MQNRNDTMHILVISFCEIIKIIATKVTAIIQGPGGFNNIKKCFIILGRNSGKLIENNCCGLNVGGTP